MFKFSFLTTVHQNSTCGAAENVETAAKPNGIMHEPVHADRPNAFTNNSSSVLSCIQTAVDIPSQSRKIDVPPNIYLESRSAMGDASILSFSSVESNTQPLNEPLMDADTTSFGFLGEMPQNFGFSDLTADFTNSSGTCLPLPSFPVISWHLWILCFSVFKVLGIKMSWYDANQA
ncbi:putative BTB/POZ domain-containing protein-like [Capsicum annuum]|nr:putative BTB/POZ domain-containing protein-like [Capsicum annuum]